MLKLGISTLSKRTFLYGVTFVVCALFLFQTKVFWEDFGAEEGSPMDDSDFGSSTPAAVYTQLAHTTTYPQLNPHPYPEPNVNPEPNPHPEPDPEREPRILLVTAMFPLDASKHTQAQYNEWIGLFLGRITTDVYVYTSPDFVSTLEKILSTTGSNYTLGTYTDTNTDNDDNNTNNNNPKKETRIRIDTTFDSPFATPPMRGLQERYREMHGMDREGAYHNPGLYAVWNSKPFLLDLAVQTLNRQRPGEEGGEEYAYAFWCDVGSFRKPHSYAAWPDVGTVRRIWEEAEGLLLKVKKEDVFFIPMVGLPDDKMKDWVEEDGPVDFDFSEGSFFGGSPSTIQWWSNLYYTYHNHYLSQGLFVGKDQTLINALLHLFPDRIITVWPTDPLSPAHTSPFPSWLDKPCGDEWYYYQFWLADERTREEMRERWIRDSVVPRWVWGLWGERRRCRVTEVLSVERVLKGLYGEEWERPVARLWNATIAE